MPDDVACLSAHAVATPNGEVKWQSAAVDVELTEGKNDEDRTKMRFSDSCLEQHFGSGNA